MTPLLSASALCDAVERDLAAERARADSEPGAAEARAARRLAYDRNALKLQEEAFAREDALMAERAAQWAARAAARGVS